MQSQTSLVSALLTLEPLVSCFTSKVGRAYVILSCPAACKQDMGQEVRIQYRKRQSSTGSDITERMEQNSSCVGKLFQGFQFRSHTAHCPPSYT